MRAELLPPPAMPAGGVPPCIIGGWPMAPVVAAVPVTMRSAATLSVPDVAPITWTWSPTSTALSDEVDVSDTVVFDVVVTLVVPLVVFTVRVEPEIEAIVPVVPGRPNPPAPPGPI